MPSAKNEARRILVIDDNPDIHKDFQRIFKDEIESSRLDELEAEVFGDTSANAPNYLNYHLDFALQGKEGAEKVLQSVTSGRPYQLAFVDMRMPPGWDGLETIEQIWLVDKNIQMVICTAYSDYSWEEIAERLGRTDNLLILKKPFDPAEVAQMASALTEKWMLRRRATLKTEELRRIVKKRTEELRRTNEILRREIAVRQHAETALRRTRFSLDHALDAVFWLDPEGRFVDMNETAGKILGYHRKELFTRRIGDIDSKMDSARWFAHWRKVRQRNSLVEEAVYQAKDGRKFPVEVVSNYIAFGQREYSCVFVRDITRRKQSEAISKKLEEKIQEGRRFESLGVMAGGIAHNFNNMLMAILGNTEMLLDELEPDTDAHQYAGKILKSSEKAADLSKKMLAYSGHGHIWPKQLSLSELVSDLKPVLESMTQLDTSINYELGKDISPISGDPAQLKQVILNIVANAVEAIGEKQGTITISSGTTACDREILEAFDTAKEAVPPCCVYIDITDNGCGMDKETRRKAFDPFFTTKFFGRGLGLAAAMGIIRRHRGNIIVSSKTGEGAVFRILLPALKINQAARETADDNAVHHRDNDHVILVVDDEEDIRQVAVEMLENAGFQALSAGDGLEALKIFRDCYDNVCCVILDMIMPDMVGNETLLEIKKIKNDVPIIISTRYTEQEVREMIGDEKIAGILFKPFEFAGLVEKVRMVLNTATAG